MASLGSGLLLKRKTLQTKVSAVFQGDQSDEEEDELPDGKKAKIGGLLFLEDAHSKSKRLKKEGIVLAENERYWDAIRHWDMALELTPDWADLHEMKAQSLLELGEVFLAAVSAETAVMLSPQWSAAWQTLGRSQLNMGELELALRNFQKAVHLDPGNEELWKEDLLWTWELVQKKAGESDSEQIDCDSSTTEGQQEGTC